MSNEKKYLKSTRNGIQSTDENGQTNMETISDWGKQSRYQPTHEIGYQGDGTASQYRIKRNPKSTVKFNKHRNKKIVQNNYFKKSQRTNSIHQNKSSQVINRPSNLKLNAVSKSNVSDKLQSGIKGVGKYIISSAESCAQSELKNSDNSALQGLEKGYGVAKSGTKAIKSISSRTKQMQRMQQMYRVKSLQQKAKIATQAAQKTAQTIKTTAQVANAGTPISIKIILVCIVLLFLIFILIGGLIVLSTALTSDDTNPELNAYVLELDNKFIAEVNALEEEKECSYDSVYVSGLERVDTSSGELMSLLTVTNHFDGKLTDKSKDIIKKYHRILNTYTLEKSDNTTIDEESKEEITRTTLNISVETYTVKQRILSFGLTKEQSELLLALLLFREQINKLDGNDAGFGGGTLTYPLVSHRYISSPYGERIHPVTGELEDFHPAIDIPAPEGTPIVSAQSGFVTYAQSNGTYGNLIKVSHGDGLETWYAHCEGFIANVGDAVAIGEPIARVGNTGRSTGPHVHFEVRVNGRHQDPMPYLK